MKLAMAEHRQRFLRDLTPEEKREFERNEAWDDWRENYEEYKKLQGSISSSSQRRNPKPPPIFSIARSLRANPTLNIILLFSPPE